MPLFTLTTLLATVVGLVVCDRVTTPPPTVPGCYHGGKAYKPGQTFGDVCSPCRCMIDGSVSCLVIDCVWGYCVDAVHDNTKCCPVCPNGPNCRSTDGTVIKEGDIYHLDNHTTCSCPSAGIGFGSVGGRQAACVVVA